jgi:hypothetical protein
VVLTVAAVGIAGVATGHAEAHPPAPGIHAPGARLAHGASLKAVVDTLHEHREAAERRERAEATGGRGPRGREHLRGAGE